MVFRGSEDNAKTVLCTRFMSPMGCRFGDRCNFAHGQHELRQRGQPASQSSGVRAQNGPRSTVLQSSSQARTAWPNPETHPQSQVGHVSGAWNSNAAHTPVSGTVRAYLNFLFNS
mmetsp:Transcript_24936/g.85336  ORF Transcript_24936/g.85336 Transcript_24936/m.85336 type:complete len:115 (+) Transcript_24936:181-525(+)